MITSLRSGSIVTFVGCLGFALMTNVAMAQSSSSETSGEQRYGGGSQGVQEKMYDDRMKDFQESQSQQGNEGQRGMLDQQKAGEGDSSLKGRSHESRQKMQQERMPEQSGSQAKHGMRESGSSMEQQKSESVDKMMGDEKGKAKEAR